MHNLENWPTCECGCGQPVPVAPQTDKRRGWVNGQPLRFINHHGPAMLGGRHRAHDVNHSFFSEWSEVMAWAFGLWATDGCLTKPQGKCRQMSITSKDKELMESLSEAMSSTYPLHNVSNKNAWTLKITSKQLYEDLLRLGLTPAKSLTMPFPDIPSKYLRHFVRGVFDGDGCANLQHPKGNRMVQLQTSFVGGSQAFADGLSEALTKLGIKHARVNHPHTEGRTHYCYIQLGPHDSVRLYHIMYDGVDEKHFLKRKRDIFLQYPRTAELDVSASLCSF